MTNYLILAIIVAVALLAFASLGQRLADDKQVAVFVVDGGGNG